ncbi:MAG: outer membrane beta-barrel protein [Ignavibacteriales bacterium]|nr:MAG: outer membrane beta-barrel protein [Ignavibacteriales bacterium]
MKYRLLILMVFLIIANQSIISQNEFAVGVNGIPAITYSYSPSDLPSPKSNFGYSFGINGAFFIQPNLFIETGLNYQNQELLYAKDILDTRKAWIDVNGNGIVDGEDRLDYSRVVPTDFSNKYSSISLPISINYRTSKINTTSFIGSFGVNLNYIYNIEGISESNQFGENFEGDKSIDDFSLSISIGVALFQPLTENISLIAGPKYFFDFYTSPKDLEAKFHTFGLEIKLNYSL